MTMRSLVITIVGILAVLAGVAKADAPVQRENITLETPFPTVVRLVKEKGAGTARQELAELARDTFAITAETCTPSLPVDEQETLVTATVAAVRLMPQLAIDPYWASQSVGQYIYTLYFRNVLELHEHAEIVVCGEGDEAVSYRREEIF